LEQEFAEIFLTAHDPGAYDLQNRIVSFTFVGHGGEFSTGGRVARGECQDH